MSIETYTDPVAALLTYRDCREIDYDDWTPYVEKIGLTASDIPELIRMVTDPELLNSESDGLEVWAPIHAWRSLGQLQAEAAIVPLTQLFSKRDDDWVTEELPAVYRRIGPAAIPTLVDYLNDSSQGSWGRVTASSCLREIAIAHPDHRADCVAAITQQLSEFADNPTELNDMLVCDLMDLKAVEAAPVIEKAFAAKRISEFGVGTWPSVQVELGLKQESDFSPSELRAEVPEEIAKLAKLLQKFDAAVNKPKGFGGAVQQKSKPKKKKK